MSNFFDLSESKKKTLSVQELQTYAERLGVIVHKISEKSNKEIKKTKQELIDEMNLCMTKTKKKSIKEIKSTSSRNTLIYQNENKRKTKVHNTKNNEISPIVLLWMKDVKDKFISEGENYKINMLNKDYIEKNFKIKVHFGSILYYGDFYIWNRIEFILIKSYMKDDIHYLSIGRKMTNKMGNAIQFFEKIETYQNNKLFIEKIKLGNNDIYLEDLQFDVHELNGIHFNYEYINEKYKFVVEMNYLTVKGDFNENFPTHTFISTKELSFLRLCDLQYKLSKHQFHFTYKINLPPHFEFKPKWLPGILVKNENIILGNIEDKTDYSYECEIYCTMYNKYMNEENLKLQYIEELNSDELLTNSKEFLMFKNIDDFDTFMIENNIDEIKY